MDETKNIVHFIQAKKTEVPSNEYFEKLATNILEQHARPTVKVIPFYKKPMFKWMAAAAVLVPFVLYLTLQGASQSQEQNDVLMSLKEIPREDIHAYIMENEEEFHIDEVVEITDLATIDAFRSETVSLNTSANPSLFEGVSKEEIESYFEYNNIDLEELEEEIFI